MKLLKALFYVLIVILINIPLSMAVFQLGYKLLSVFSFIASGIVTGLIYMVFPISLYIYFKSENQLLSIILLVCGVIFALIVGFLIYALISV